MKNGVKNIQATAYNGVQCADGILFSIKGPNDFYQKNYGSDVKF